MIPLWKIPQTEVMLTEKDIHVWRADLELPTIGLQNLYQTLSIDEKKRAERFHFEKDRRRFIAGRGILRTILGHYLNVEPNRLDFSYGKNGKPKLADTLGDGTVHFNMAHSAGIAIYGFTRGREIGVDVEYIRDIPEMNQIAERFFSVREYDIFRALPKSKKKEAFFNCWTRKEAFLKAIGVGLFQPLNSFDVSIVPGEPAKLLAIERNAREACRWSIQDLKPASRHAAAFAVKEPSWRIYCWQWRDNSPKPNHSTLL